MRIYLASSWRNDAQQDLVRELRARGHEVYDFKHPAPGNTGFHWTAIDKNWKEWTPTQFRKALEHKIAFEGFTLDFEAMEWSEVVLLLMPCGRSAHLELGWGVGAGKRTAILLSNGEPELMYRMVEEVFVSSDELFAWLDSLTVA